MWYTLIYATAPQAQHSEKIGLEYSIGLNFDGKNLKELGECLEANKGNHQSVHFTQCIDDSQKVQLLRNQWFHLYTNIRPNGTDFLISKKTPGPDSIDDMLGRIQETLKIAFPDDAATRDPLLAQMKQFANNIDAIALERILEVFTLKILDALFVGLEKRCIEDEIETMRVNENIFQYLKAHEYINLKDQSLADFQKRYAADPWAFVFPRKKLQKIVLGCGNFDKCFVEDYNRGPESLRACFSCTVNHGDWVTVSLDPKENPDICIDINSQDLWKDIPLDSIDELYDEENLINSDIIARMKPGSIYYQRWEEAASSETGKLLTAKNIRVIIGEPRSS